MKVYIASRLANRERVRKLEKQCLDLGWTITYCWTIHGQLFDPDELRMAGESEKNGVLDADVFIAVAPMGVGSGIEFGLALGENIPIMLLVECPIEEKPFFHLPMVRRFTTEESLFRHLVTMNIVGAHGAANLTSPGA